MGVEHLPSQIGLMVVLETTDGFDLKKIQTAIYQGHDKNHLTWKTV